LHHIDQKHRSSALLDAVTHTPPVDHAVVQVRVLKTASELQAITTDDIRQAQAADENLQPVIQLLIKSSLHSPHADL